MILAFEILVSSFLLLRYKCMIDFFHVPLVSRNLAISILRRFWCRFFGIFNSHVLCE